jgi:PPM family protein phosphatase
LSGAAGEMKIRPGIELGNLTDVGCQRENNQDSYCYAEPESEEQFQKKGRLVVVADGMGGHEGGEFASGIAVDVLRDTYVNSEINDPELALADALGAAHQAIRNFAREHPEYTGMGTTCTAAVLRDGHLYYGHVGDSRLYLLRDSGVKRLTRDQTVTGRMVEEGLLGPEEAKQHPDYHVLTDAMGVGESVAAEFPSEPIPLLTGDILLLCSDGLHDLVSDDEIGKMARQGEPGEACKQLIETAKSRGGHDNITVQIVKVA